MILVNIFSTHQEISDYMAIHEQEFKHLDHLQKHRMCDKLSSEFITAFEEGDSEIEESDFTEEIKNFMISKRQPKFNPREV